MTRNQRDENIIISGGEIIVGGDNIIANGTNNVTISNVAPAAVGTATISYWLKIEINGTLYFIPMWT